MFKNIFQKFTSTTKWKYLDYFINHHHGPHGLVRKNWVGRGRGLRVCTFNKLLVKLCAWESGELCGLIPGSWGALSKGVTRIIEKGGDSLLIQKVLDFGVFSNFRDKLEAIKAQCVAMARGCLESLTPPILPRLVTSHVLEKLLNDDFDHIGTRAKFKKYTEEEKTVLRNTLESLSSIYVTIRDLAKKCAFCSHDRHPARRIFSFIVPLNPNETEIEVKGRELNFRMVQFEPEEFWGS